MENSIGPKAIENIKRAGIPVIIFGAGVVGEVLFQACRNAGIKVECFCDNNTNKTRLPVCGTNVIHAPDLKTKYKDASFLISAADIHDVIAQLRRLGYSKWHTTSLLLREFDVSQCRFSAPMDFVEYAVATSLLCQDSYLNPDKLFLRSVDIIITERCSLKCRDCSNLMQYYKKPVDCGIDELKESIDAFCFFVDEVNEFRVIGGEPFMYKDFHLIMARLIDEPKVKKIVIYTNGTIIPGEDKIEYLKNAKTLTFITDYGALSRRLSDLTQIFLRNKIAFYIYKARGWTDCTKITKRCRSIEGEREIFKNCCAKNTFTLSKGRLYRCPFSANAARLKAVPDYRNDYIDMLQKPRGDADINEMKKKIRAFLLEKPFLQTCDYCSGRTYGDPEIEPAVQIKKPLEYERNSSQ